jgi:hydroxymethylbilane synthase
MKKTWTVGTRGSKLALTQTNLVIARLKTLYPECEFTINIIKTTGDTVWDTPLYDIGEKGLFIKEIEDALLNGGADIAVHSMKDLPTDLPEGLAISAILEREDPRDTFISEKYNRLSDVPVGARIGTSSMRRKAQLLAYRKDLTIVPLRGNVDTRLRKLKDENLDGIILAYAGVRRMGFADQVRQVLPLDIMVPPCGQGAIGIETRRDDEATALVKPLNDAVTATEVSLERQFQLGVGGGCSIPLGVNAAIVGDTVTIHAVFGAEDGTLIFKDKVSDKLEQGTTLVDWLLTRLREKQKTHNSWE